MSLQATATLFPESRQRRLPSLAAAQDLQVWPRELLPFTVRLVQDAEDLSKAVEIRQAAYARHVPALAEKLRAAEAADDSQGNVVLLAESKLDGSSLGTMRIHTNAFATLPLEQSITLPHWLAGRRLSEATRLGVANGKAGRMVTTLLFKAYWLYCQQAGVEWMVVAGRAPVDRQYDRLLFEDVFPGAGYIPMAHASNLPHRVMAFNVPSSQQRWVQAQHPLYEFMCETDHPDIHIGDGGVKSTGLWDSQEFRSQATSFAM